MMIGQNTIVSEEFAYKNNINVIWIFSIDQSKETNLSDKPSRLGHERQSRDKSAVLIVKSVWNLLLLINVHVVHCAQVLIYLH